MGVGPGRREAGGVNDSQDECTIILPCDYHVIILTYDLRTLELTRFMGGVIKDTSKDEYTHTTDSNI